jgi:NADP-dependent aldehyde dehydrogenase
VFGASNFPLAFGIVGGDTASAWAARCPVIAKSHPSHPQTSEMIAIAVEKAIEKANFPEGWFSLIQGEQIKTGQAIVKHPLTKAIGFTGSLAGGRAIYNSAAEREEPIPVYAEMGSINPIFLMPSVINQDEPDLENLAQILVDSITLGVGQFCTKPGVIFIPDNTATERFIQIMKETMAEKETGPLLNNRICGLLDKKIEPLRKEKGVDIKIGGHRSEDQIFFENTLLVTTADRFINNKILQTENFGPVSLLVKTESPNRYANLASHLEGQLTGSIFYNPLDKQEIPQVTQLMEELQYHVGRIIFNGVPTGVEVCHAMQHGGPYPATTAPKTTSVGMTAIRRFLRPIAYQNVDDTHLPKELKDHAEKPNLRMINGEYQLKK